MTDDRWSVEQAASWYHQLPWLVGCNFTPSTAINQLEMWQSETFDPQTIDKELGWAESLGFTTARVYLHDLVWQNDPQGFKQRIDRFLSIASRHAIKPLFVIFDDCWDQHPASGAQRAPKPGVHNSGWVQSPGTDIVLDPSKWTRLAAYVADILTAFGSDDRILLWDLYNEPGNNDLGERTLPLLQAAFAWARGAKPSQPLSVGVWSDNQKINDFILSASDVITFHNYEDAESLRRQIDRLKNYHRPLICTEYMARTRSSRFETHLPIFKNEHIGCINWGLVSGKTQTIFPWGSPEGSPEPGEWFHDIFRPDGTPYRQSEVDFIRSILK